VPLEQLQVWIGEYGYVAIYVLLTLGIVGLPVPDETLLALTGFLVFRGKLQLAPAYLSALLGTVSGISLSYAIGRIGGRRLVRRFGRYLHVTPDRMTKAANWFSHRGRWSLLIGYFIPGVRHLIALVAGSTTTEFRTFALFAYSGATLWAAIFIGAGYSFGEGWAEFPGLMRKLAIGLSGAALFGFGVFAFIRSHREKRKQRGSSLF
jgi:membrane protein DedA with SNARE-associated domain